MTTDDMSVETTVVPEDGATVDDTTSIVADETTDTMEEVDTGEEPGEENPFNLEEQDEPEEEKGEDEPFNMEVPEGFELDDGLKAEYENIAKEMGLPGGKAGKYISKVIEADMEARAKQLEAQEKELRKEWGASFNDNVKAARTFCRQIAGRAGIDMRVMQVFASPAGFKLMYALSQAVGEPKVVTGAPSNQGTNEAEANRMITDPSHPLYDAFYNQDDPRHEQANKTYNRLVGLE